MHGIQWLVWDMMELRDKGILQTPKRRTLRRLRYLEPAGAERYEIMIIHAQKGAGREVGPQGIDSERGTKGEVKGRKRTMVELVIESGRETSAFFGRRYL